MRRTLAFALAALLPAAAIAEPLDLDLGQLGAPDARVWTAVGFSGDANLAAADARSRFGMLASDLTLAVTSSLLTPGSTTGHSGFDMALEGAYSQTHAEVSGTASGSFNTASGASTFGPRDYWPTRGMTPHELFVPAIRIRKALPFSFELGARFKYLSQSALYAGQIEGKWAFFEGDRVVPDFALRLAYTRVAGVRTLNIGATDVDFVVSKRFGILGVVSLTPYGAVRFTYMRASSDPIEFFPAASSGTVEARTASFPTLSGTFFRPTLGVRMTTYALSLAAEITQYGGGTFKTDNYNFRLQPSLAGSFRFGFEF
jgi:hypothetical protein